MQIYVSGAYVIGAGQTVTSNGDQLAFYLNDSSQLTILGSLHVQSFVIGMAADAAFGFSNFSMEIGAGGSVDVVASSPANIGYGFYVNTGPASFTNHGALHVSGPVAIGAYTGNNPSFTSTFSNTNTFTVTATSSGAGVEYGNVLMGANSGVMTISGSSADGVRIKTGGAFTNSGVITATASGGFSRGIVADNQLGGATTIINSGTITADDAVTYQYNVGNILLSNSGALNGNVLFDTFAGNELHNTGAIHGSVSFAGVSGTQLFDGRGGSVSGTIAFASSGSTPGSAFAYLGNDGETITGGAAALTANGGTGADSITGGAGADFITGGGGNDTLAGGGGADTFAFRVPSGSATITDFSHAQGDKIDLSALGYDWAMVQAALTGSTDTAITLGGLTITLDGITPGSLQSSDFVFGTIMVSPTDNFAVAGSVVINATSRPLVQFTGTAGGTLTNDGAMSLMASFTVTGVVTTAYLADDQTAVFENNGSFSVTGSLGVAGIAFATLHNAGTFDVTGTSNPFVTYGATGDVVNSGHMTIVGSASAHGVDDGNTHNGTFRNLAGGVLSVTSAGGWAWGVELDFGSDFENNGQLTVSAPYGNAYGVIYQAYAVSNTLINTGTITATGGGTLSFGIEVMTRDGVSSVNLTNSGTITAEYAISYVDALGGDIVNTGVLNGAVSLGNGTTVFDSHAGTINGFVGLGKGSNAVTLGGEDNTVGIAAGTNVVDGGGGINTIAYGSVSGVNVSLALQGHAQNTGVSTDTLSNFKALIGSVYNDTLEGGGFASTTLTGGAGADTFVYRSGNGAVGVTDFSHAQGDNIDLSGLDAFFSLADVLAQAHQTGSNTVIAVTGGSLTLQDVSLATLTAADFKFTPGPTVGPNVGGTPQTASGTLTGGAGGDWLQGGGGPDTLHGGAGSDYLDGGAGLNTATYDGSYLQYVVVLNAAAVSGGPEGGTDFLANIQRIQFVDGYLATGTTDTAGQVYRVYEATLGRAPDQQGLANWAHALNAGTSLQTVVNGFVGSAEFQALYGNLDNPAFVTLLYNNVLHRAPDQAGLDNWVAYIAAGHSRAEVVTGFSESPEDIAALAAPVQQGQWIEDTAAGQVARLYDAVFGRLPDASGLANWTHMLESGTSLQTAAGGFVGSAEFQANYGNLDANSFVTLLYQNVLHRAPDTAGLNGWLSYLTQGHSRAEVVLGFSESGEHIANTAAHVDYGVWIAG